MNTQIPLAICILVLTILGCKSSPAPAVVSDPARVRDAQVDFVHVYVAARQSKDASRIANLFHPNVRACINDRNRPFFDFVVSQEIHNVPKGDYTKLTITPVAPRGSPLIWAFFPAKGFPYAVMPTHTIQMDYELGPNHSYSNIIEVAPSANSWYMVTACPNALGMQVMRKLQTQGLQQKARAKKLAGELRDPLLSRIKALLAKHDRLQADKAYQKATGADLTTAESVMDAIGNPKN